MRSHRPARSRGFTLGELVLSIVLMGILAAIALPRMMSSKGFASRGFYDEAQSVVRYAQKTAIAWRRPILVCIDADKIRAISTGTCAAPLTAVPNPVHTSDPLQTSTAPDGVVLSPVGSFSFDGMGKPSAAIIITLASTIANDPTPRLINVALETGYVSR